MSSEQSERGEGGERGEGSEPSERNEGVSLRVLLTNETIKEELPLPRAGDVVGSETGGWHFFCSYRATPMLLNLAPRATCSLIYVASPAARAAAATIPPVSIPCLILRGDLYPDYASPIGPSPRPSATSFGV